MKKWLYESLDASLHWFRDELTIIRDALYYHALEKRKSDLDLTELNKTVTKISH